MKHIAKLLILSVIAVASSEQAFAAPFCAVFSFGRQCYYYDLPSCQKAAGTAGACVINQDEVQAPSANEAPFCVVHSYGTQCYYWDAQSCRRDAENSGGACVVNPNRR